jgi:hypothetical protein
MLFNAQFPDIADVTIQPVWVAGELLEFGGDFFKYISGRDLAKQEGLIFRHLLRLVLLLGEFSQLTPANVDPMSWRNELRDLAMKLTESCRKIDPNSTDSALQQASRVDIVHAEDHEPAPIVELLATATPSDKKVADASMDDFGAGILDEDAI